MVYSPLGSIVARVALAQVNLKQCRAGTGGGGSVLLGGEAEVDLLECNLEDNQAESSGGHIQVVASLLSNFILSLCILQYFTKLHLLKMRSSIFEIFLNTVTVAIEEMTTAMMTAVMTVVMTDVSRQFR